MNSTPTSLLERLQRPVASSDDWKRLHDLYLPLVRAWLARTPCIGNEADDVAQEVMLILLREIPKFRRRREGSFRVWLRKVTTNRVRAWWRGRQRQPFVGFDEFLSQLEDPNSPLAQSWNQEHDQHIFEKLLAVVKSDFDPTTWQAFRLFVLENRKALEVAAELGLTENAVLLCKSRILKRLREESAGLL